MALFESGIVQNSSPGTICTAVWNPGNTSATTLGPLGSVPSSAILSNPVVTNTGTVTVYLQAGSVTAASTTGLPLPVNASYPLQGFTGGVVGVAGTIWANTAVVGTTGQVNVGMASVASVV